MCKVSTTLTSVWCSTTGAIDADAFRAAHGEMFATFSKVQPYLAELRTVSGEPDFCKHLEWVVMNTTGAEEILGRRQAALRQLADLRKLQKS